MEVDSNKLLQHETLLFLIFRIVVSCSFFSNGTTGTGEEGDTFELR
jgi:hypothetical protein